ncbi:MAG TPA: hypothetical protein VF283_12670 [Bryobacteraceae bacterium]
MDVYGWLTGSWELEVCQYAGADLRALQMRGEAHFGWVLEGRAVQDVWIMPRIAERGPHLDKTNNMYGTTFRVWNPAIQAWHIEWMNPASGHRERQTGRRIGNEIVQTGARPDGTATRWRFTEITSDSFHWIGEALQPDGRSWMLEGEFRAKRMDPAGEPSRFHSALMAPGRSQEIVGLEDLYGCLIGSWELEVHRYEPGGSSISSNGEVHFTWALEGRAVQDVWIMPKRPERAVGMDKRVNRYGTTLRIWNPSIQAWDILWIDPVTGNRDQMIARRVGQDIVQVGTQADGTPIRWSFTEVTGDSFHWLGESLQDDGRTWRLGAEFYARRKQ